MSKKEKKSEPQKTEKAPRKSPSSGSLPVLFDVSFSISKLIIILIGVLTSVISVISGATVFSAAIRASLAMLAIGITLWLINWIMVKESLAGVLIKVNKLKAKTSENGSEASTVEKNI
ncbi:MAG: hypothetical protein GYA34_04000 [Chloroflexi bacterium]|nr:hypothetical protein [Chloroflexota bacterium]